MGNELRQTYPTGYTLYAMLFNATNQVYNGSAFEALADANWGNYDIAMTEAGTATEEYLGNMPSVAAGVYTFTVRRQAGGSPAVDDSQVGDGIIYWDGSAEVSLAAILTNTTQTVASVASAGSGGTLTLMRGDTWSIALTGMGDISARSKLWFTIKETFSDTDAQSIVQIDTATGLLYINGAAWATAANGSITVDDENAGDITIALDEAASDDLVPAEGLRWDVQMLDTSNDVTTMTEGRMNITGDVTRAIT